MCLYRGDDDGRAGSEGESKRMASGKRRRKEDAFRTLASRFVSLLVAKARSMTTRDDDDDDGDDDD